jgi:hypothetical protein
MGENKIKTKFFPPKLTPNFSIKVTQDKHETEVLRKTPTEKWLRDHEGETIEHHTQYKKEKENKWIIENIQTYVGHYREQENHIDEVSGLYYLSSISNPKILPEEIGKKIIEILNKNYDIILKNGINYTNKTLSSIQGEIKRNQQDNSIPCLTIDNKNNMLIMLENESFEENKGVSGLNILNRTEKVYKDSNGCYLFFDNQCIKKIFQCLKLIDNICYPNTHEGLMYRNEDTKILASMFDEKWHFVDEYKNGTPEEKLNYEFLVEYYQATKKDRRDEILCDKEIRKLIPKIITIKKVKKFYHKLFNTDKYKKLKNFNIKNGSYQYQGMSEELWEKITNYYANFNYILTLIDTCGKAYLFENILDKREDRKENGKIRLEKELKYALYDENGNVIKDEKGKIVKRKKTKEEIKIISDKRRQTRLKNELREYEEAIARGEPPKVKIIRINYKKYEQDLRDEKNSRGEPLYTNEQINNMIKQEKERRKNEGVEKRKKIAEDKRNAKKKEISDKVLKNKKRKNKN